MLTQFSAEWWLALGMLLGLTVILVITIIVSARTTKRNVEELTHPTDHNLLN